MWNQHTSKSQPTSYSTPGGFHWQWLAIPLEGPSDQELAQGGGHRQVGNNEHVDQVPKNEWKWMKWRNARMNGRSWTDGRRDGKKEGRNERMTDWTTEWSKQEMVEWLSQLFSGPLRLATFPLGCLRQPLCWATFSRSCFGATSFLSQLHLLWPSILWATRSLRHLFRSSLSNLSSQLQTQSNLQVKYLWATLCRQLFSHPNLPFAARTMRLAASSWLSRRTHQHINNCSWHSSSNALGNASCNPTEPKHVPTNNSKGKAAVPMCFANHGSNPAKHGRTNTSADHQHLFVEKQLENAFGTRRLLFCKGNALTHDTLFCSEAVPNAISVALA